MAQMLARCPLAAYSFTGSNGLNIRVCYQDKSGQIRQHSYDKDAGWHPGDNGTVGRADLNNGLAIIGWDAGKEERVYYVGKDNKIVERCLSAGTDDWYNGTLTGKFKAAHYSNVAVVTFVKGGIRRIQVYYQGPDNAIREASTDNPGGWTDTYVTSPVMQGTSIACSYIPGKRQWLFYQKTDTTFVEQVKKESGPWNIGAFKSQLVYDPGAYITWAHYDGRYRVFTVDRENKLCVTEYEPTTGWAQTKQLATLVPFSAAAAVILADSPRIRVYLQTNPNLITEWGTNDGSTYRESNDPLPGQ